MSSGCICASQAGTGTRQCSLSSLHPPAARALPGGRAFLSWSFLSPVALVPGSVVDKRSPQVWLSGLHRTSSPLRELSRWAGDVLPCLELSQAATGSPPLLRGDRHPWNKFETVEILWGTEQGQIYNKAVVPKSPQNGKEKLLISLLHSNLLDLQCCEDFSGA